MNDGFFPNTHPTKMTIEYTTPYITTSCPNSNLKESISFNIKYIPSSTCITCEKVDAFAQEILKNSVSCEDNTQKLYSKILESIHPIALSVISTTIFDNGSILKVHIEK